GVDCGTSTTKAVVVDAARRILGSHVRRSGANLLESAQEALAEALKGAGLEREELAFTMATGFGRRSVSFAQDSKTEISCHSTGCHFYYPEEITVIDIGGQDNKVIKLDASGRKTSFKMNRKCSAGTGAFLEEMAYKLNIPVSDLEGLARRSTQGTELGSFCTVFTATEVLDRIRGGERVEDIIRGLFNSVAKRILEMERLSGRVIMSGGVVAHNPIVAEIISERAGVDVEIAPHPQEMGAFGAALFAAEAKPVQAEKEDTLSVSRR
ncbi:MAG: acyl-CoA dehydratase activase, partial [Anaerolineae bacterium]|nr:acyl-CoA dehydratase activase [Anaerolineae bacterium]